MTIEPPGDDLQRPEDHTEEQPLAREVESDTEEDDLPLLEEPEDAEPHPVTAFGLSDWPPTPDLQPQPEHRTAPSHSVITSLVVIFLAIAVVAATAFAVKLYREKAAIANATDQAVALIGAGAPPELSAQIAAIQGDLTAGRATDASEKLASLNKLLTQSKQQGEGAGAGGGAKIPEQAFKDLPADAATFFRQHQDLFRRFLMLCARAKEMRDQGKDVARLRTMRDEIIESARLDQEDSVKTKLLQMVRMMGAGGPAVARGGRGGGGGGGDLRRKVERLKRQAARAEAQGKDLRAVYGLMRQAEQSAQSGDMASAGKHLDEALAAVARAPRMAGHGRRGGPGRDAMLRRRLGAQGRESRANPLAPFVRALLGVMTAEENNLRDVTDQLVGARKVILGSQPPAEKPDLLKPMVDRALGDLQIMADRRQELTARMPVGRKPGAAGKLAQGLRPGQQRPGQLTPEERRSMMAIVRDRVGAVLDRVRSLTDEEYKRDRVQIIRDILRAVLERPKPETSAQAEQQWPKDQGERIRAKMLKSSPVLRQWKTEGKDSTEVGRLFAEARKALYDKKLDASEKLVDEAMVLLGIEQPRVELPPASPGN
ncbi:MAG: hypothetical protein ABFE07_06790 [Armatimonadia bacterium]